MKYSTLQLNKAAFKIEDAHKQRVSITREKVNVSTKETATLCIYCIVQDNYDVCDLYVIESLIHSGIYQVNLETTFLGILLPKSSIDAKMTPAKKNPLCVMVYITTCKNVNPCTITT